MEYIHIMKIMSTWILFTLYGFTFKKQTNSILTFMDCPNSLPLQVPHYNPKKEGRVKIIFVVVIIMPELNWLNPEYFWILGDISGY